MAEPREIFFAFSVPFSRQAKSYDQDRQINLIVNLGNLLAFFATTLEVLSTINRTTSLKVVNGTENAENFSLGSAIFNVSFFRWKYSCRIAS